MPLTPPPVLTAALDLTTAAARGACLLILLTAAVLAGRALAAAHGRGLARLAAAGAGQPWWLPGNPPADPAVLPATVLHLIGRDWS